jgi:hypothetical protein
MLDSPITVEFETVHLQEIFEFIHEFYDAEFVFDDHAVAAPGQDAAGSVSNGIVEYLHLKNVPLRDALDAILTPLKLEYIGEGARIRIRAKHSAAVSIPNSTRDFIAREYTPSAELFVLPDGALRFGKSLLHLDPQAGGKLLDSDYELIATPPAIEVKAGRHAKIDMSRSVEYLAPKPNAKGEFVLNTTALEQGRSIDFTLKEIDDEMVECDLAMTLGSISDRRTLPGTSLKVGEPVFETTTANGQVRMKLGRQVAILTKLGEQGDDVFLALLRVVKVGSPQPISASAEAPAEAKLPQYSLATRIVEVRGEPDWQWWMRPYERAARIYAGAGQVLGPVLVPRIADSPKRFDWGRLGFDKVTWPAPDASRDVTSIVDHKFPYKQSKISFRGDDSRPPRPAVDPSHPVFDAYKDVAPDAPPLTPADVQGKANMVSMTAGLDQNGQPATKCDMFAIGEASPTPVAGVFHLDQKVLLNKPRLETKTPAIRRQLEFSYETADDSMLAFLLPIADNEYWIVLTDFSLVKE